MSKTTRRLAVSALLMFAASAAAQRTAPQPTPMPHGRNIEEMKFAPVAAVPTCTTVAVASGDPAKGASVIVIKAEDGCVIPWHWHTANEQVMVVDGQVRFDMKDGKPLTLRAGGHALLPSRHLHQFRCTGSCTAFISSDVAFDIHYVDARGKAITPEAAIKAVNEKLPPARSPT